MGLTFNTLNPDGQMLNMSVRGGGTLKQNEVASSSFSHIIYLLSRAEEKAWRVDACCTGMKS